MPASEKDEHGFKMEQQQQPSYDEEKRMDVKTNVSDDYRAEEEEENSALEEVTFGKMMNVPTWRRTFVITGLAIGLFLAIMDSSIISTAIYTIALDFDSLAGTIWVVLAYTIVYLGFAVIFARLSDFIGRQAAILGAFTIFFAFSIGGGFSQTLNQLIVCRAFQGLGGSGLYALGLIIMIEACAPGLLVIISGLIGFVVAIGGVMGPLIGGLLTEYASWRWVFWINAPIAFVALALLSIGWPKNHAQLTRKSRPFRQFDYIGSILIVAASVLFIFGLQEAGTGAYPWNSALVLATIIIGVLCWVLLVAWEVFISKAYPSVAAIFPVEIMTNRPLMAAFGCATLAGFVIFQYIISIPLRFQIVNLKSPATAGVHMLPMLASSGVGSFVGSGVSKKKNRVFQTLAIGGALVLLGAGLFTTLDTDLSAPVKEYGFQVILGFGVGMTFSSVSLLTSLETNVKTHAVGQGIIGQMRIFGGSIGIAASNALFNAQSKSTLNGVLSSAQIAAIQTSTQVVQSLTPEQKNLVRVAYARAFRDSSFVCVAVSVLYLVSALCAYQRNPKDPAEIAERVRRATHLAELRQRTAAEKSSSN